LSEYVKERVMRASNLSGSRTVELLAVESLEEKGKREGLEAPRVDPRVGVIFVGLEELMEGRDTEGV